MCFKIYSQDVVDTSGKQIVIVKRPLFLLNNAGVKWTILPKFSPIIIANQVLENQIGQGRTNEVFPENNFTAGLRFYRYSPLTPVTFGVETNYLHQSLSLKKKTIYSLFTGSMEITPFVSISSSDILKVDKKNNSDLFHLNIEGGISYSNAINRSLSTYDPNNINYFNETGIIDNDSWRIYCGIGYIYDALSSAYRHAEQFKFMLQYYRPLGATYFKNIYTADNTLSKVANHTLFQEYLTFNVGYLFAIDKPKIRSKQSKYEELFPKRYRFFRMPWYYEEPEKKSFGGFYWSLVNTPKTSNINYHTGDSLTLNGNFRVRYNMSVGYHLHFLSNFNQYQKNVMRYSIFAGISYNQRQIIQDYLLTIRYQNIPTISADFGGRIGVLPGIYLLAGGSYHFDISEKKIPQDKSSFGYLKRNFITYYAGLGFRNLISIQIQNNPLIPFSFGNYNFLNTVEYKITAGF